MARCAASTGGAATGEAKLVRCARGAIFDVLVDARPGSPTFGQHMAVTLDDTAFAHLYIPPGILHGFQALTEQTDVCYRIDREHVPGEDLAVRYDDPTLGYRLALGCRDHQPAGPRRRFVDGSGRRAGDAGSGAAPGVGDQIVVERLTDVVPSTLTTSTCPWRW